MAKLRDCGVTLIDCDHRTPPAAVSGYPYVAIPQLKHGRLDLAGVRHISEKDFIEWTRKAKPRGFDVVLSRRCNPGETAFVPPGLDFAVGQNLVLLRSDGSKLDPQFLRWLLRGPGWWQEVRRFINVGAVFDSLRCADIPNFELPIPPILEQRAIAHILGTLDDKIELNRRTNETLEAMARALFKSWFVDFDPVQAKAEGRAPSGMDAETAKLFPNEFVDSELGRIPKGWRVGTLSDVAELNPESWSKGTYPHIIAYVDLSGTKWGRIEGISSYSREDAPSRAQRVLRNGDTIVGTVRPGNGSFALVADSGLTGSTGFAVLRPRRSTHTGFVYLAATARDNIERLAHLADGGAYPAVRSEIVAATPVVCPDEAVFKQFENRVRLLHAQIASNDRESATIATTRDTLLPRLLSGELPIPPNILSNMKTSI